MQEPASPSSSAYQVPIEPGKNREFVIATRSGSPAYRNSIAVITPTFLTTAHNFWEPVDQNHVARLRLDTRRVLHGEEKYIFHGSLPRAGQTLTVTTRVGKQYEKQGKRGGVMRFVVVVSEFCDDAGALFAEQHTTVIETAPPPRNGRIVMTAKTKIAIPDVGDTWGPRTFRPITRTDIVRYAGASGDFNPIHHDQGFAESAGIPTVFSIGMLQAGLLATYATDSLGAENVRLFAVRFVEQVWPGDELTCTGVVTAVESDGANAVVDVGLTCARRQGRIAVSATARFQLTPISAH